MSIMTKGLSQSGIENELYLILECLLVRKLYE